MNESQNANLYEFLNKEISSELVQTGWSPSDPDDFGIRYSDPSFEHMDPEQLEFIQAKLGYRPGSLLVTPAVMKQVARLRATAEKIAQLRSTFESQWRVLEAELQVAVSVRQQANPYVWANIEELNSICAELYQRRQNLSNSNGGKKAKRAPPTKAQQSSMDYVKSKLEQAASGD